MKNHCKNIFEKKMWKIHSIKKEAETICVIKNQKHFQNVLRFNGKIDF